MHGPFHESDSFVTPRMRIEFGKRPVPVEFGHDLVPIPHGIHEPVKI